MSGRNVVGLRILASVKGNLSLKAESLAYRLQGTEDGNSVLLIAIPRLHY